MVFIGAKLAISPVPAAANPIPGVSFVQLKIVPATFNALEKATAVVESP